VRFSSPLFYSWPIASSAAYQPENQRLEGWLAIATAVGVAAILAPGLLVWNEFVSVPKDVSEIEIVGQQWQWSFRLPGKDNQLGTSDPRYVTAENLLGLNPNDPHGQDDLIIVGDDLHLPLGKPIKVLLRSLDTIHDFYVPEFRAKMDLMPGLVSYFWFTPTKAGTYDILCAAFCGVGHPYMRGTIILEKESDYQAWLQSQHTFAQLSARTKKAEVTY
jgi:cytochrome c oxidase subunit 2